MLTIISSDVFKMTDNQHIIITRHQTDIKQFCRKPIIVFINYLFNLSEAEQSQENASCVPIHLRMGTFTQNMPPMMK